MLNEIDSTKTGCLRTKNRTAPCHTLSGKHSCIVLLGKLLIHSVHETDFTSAYTDITRRDILIRTYHFPELKHECLTETHDLGIRLSSRIEIRTAFSATHRKGCEGILESLLETEELQDGKVYRRMEAEASLIRSDSRVELHAVACIGLDLAIVVYPCHLECKDTLRLDDTLDDLGILKLRMLIIHFLH